MVLAEVGYASLLGLRGISLVLLHVDLARRLEQLLVIKLLLQLLAARIKLLKGAQILLLIDVTQLVKLPPILLFQVGWQAQVFTVHYSVVQVRLEILGVHSLALLGNSE